jgi:hypothetical protein
MDFLTKIIINEIAKKYIYKFESDQIKNGEFSNTKLIIEVKNF